MVIQVMALIALVFAATCERGGSPYWVTFFGGLPGGVQQQQTCSSWAIGPGDVLATALGLASGGVVIPGVPGANAAAVAAAAGRTGGIPDWQKTYRNDSNMNREEMLFMVRCITTYLMILD